MNRRPLAAAVVAGAVLLSGGGIAWATGGTSGHYRTATATIADVESTMSLSGTVASSSRRDMSFGVAGTLKKISVAVGDTVTTGQTLATLDPEDLDAAVTRAKADLAKATAQLESDQSSQAATVSAAVASTAPTAASNGTASATTASFTTPVAAPSASSPELTKALAALKEQQTAVAAAQSAATDAIAAAKAALTAQAAACVVDEPEEPAEESAEPEPTPDVSTACTDALAAVQAAQDVVADRQDDLQSALTELADTLADAIETLSSTSAPSAGDTDQPDKSDGQSSGGQSSGGKSAGEQSDGSAGSGGSGGNSAGGGSSAGSIAQDQAAIDIAAAALTEAELARDSATMTAPFAGTVLDVSAAAGADVAASDVVVIIAGDGGSTVTTTVTVDQVAQVEKGQAAHVTPAGADEPVDGTVSEIGMLPTTGDTVTYPVTIDLADDVAAPEGAGATIELVTSTVTGAVTVPSSAISNTGRTTVTVLQDGAATLTPVTVGVVGATRTSITENLEAGQVVVLADLDAELPTGDTTTTGRTGFGGGTGGGRPGRGQ